MSKQQTEKRRAQRVTREEVELQALRGDFETAWNRLAAFIEAQALLEVMLGGIYVSAEARKERILTSFNARTSLEVALYLKHLKAFAAHIHRVPTFTSNEDEGAFLEGLEDFHRTYTTLRGKVPEPLDPSDNKAAAS